MNQNIQIETLFQALPILIGFYFIIRFIALGESYKSSHRYISLLFLLIGCIEGFAIGIDYLSKENAYYLIPVFLGSALSFAPTIYLFVRNITVKRNKTQNFIKYFVPAIVLSVIDFVLFYLINNLDKANSLRTIVYWAVWFVTLGGLTVGFLIQNIILLIRSFKLIRIYQEDLGEYYSFAEGVNLEWVKVFIYGYIFFFIGVVVTSLPGVDEYFLYSFDIVLIVFIIFSGSKALKQYNVLKTIEAVKLDNQSAIPENIEEVEKELLEQDVSDKFNYIKKDLEKVMEEDKPFLNPTLTIYELARLANTNYKYLSKLINNEYQMNFANFINHYRIEEAKTKLKDPKTRNYKIEAIAELVGFNSKSAYNSAFKKFTGKTPSQYRDAA